jgi:predicted amino acid-binding ACT domain protein
VTTEPDRQEPTPAGAGWLVQLTGPDRPGITADLMTTLDLLDAEVQDVEQVLVRGMLTLAVAVSEPSDHDALRSTLQHLASQYDLRLDLSPIPASSGRRPHVDAVTVLGHGFETPLSAAELAAVAGGVVAAGGNVDRVVRLARYPVYAYEFRVSGADPLALRTHLGQATRPHRPKRLAIWPDAAAVCRRHWHPSIPPRCPRGPPRRSPASLPRCAPMADTPPPPLPTHTPGDRHSVSGSWGVRCRGDAAASPW